MTHKSMPVDGFENTTIPAGAQTIQLKTSKGFVHSISWATGAAGAGKLDLYDDAAANVNQKDRIDAANLSDSHLLDIKMVFGIRIVTDANWLGGNISWR